MEVVIYSARSLRSPFNQPTRSANWCYFRGFKYVKAPYSRLPSAHFAAIFDAKGKTFRHDMYDAYKANRAKMPDDLGIQIEPLKQMIKSLGIPLISIQGVEADDVIGTCANYFKQKDFDILVSTGDKDLAQIVDNKITIVDTMKNKVLNPAGVKDKFGVEATQIIDYLALIGDTSDNIPGVPKVGPKTAVKWLDEYKNLDNIIQNADKFKGKVGEYLRENQPIRII